MSLTLMIQFPQIERISNENAVAVRTWVGEAQIGNVVPVARFRAEEDKEEWLNSAEAELRREGEKQGWNLD